MRTYEDTFSGQRIFPGKGKIYVRGDSKVFRFQNGKSESLFLQRKNPRRIAWTEVAKKRTRRTVKAQRAIVGASLDVIKERRSMRPEARSAARAQAIKESKEKKQAAQAAKKAEKAKNAAQAAKGQTQRNISKQGAKGAPVKVKKPPVVLSCDISDWVWTREGCVHETLAWRAASVLGCRIQVQEKKNNIMTMLATCLAQRREVRDEVDDGLLGIQSYRL
ncbi:hypothetical protein CDD80_6094 [Ophiocordyceps camponoti-rufipedis]|uniref:Large ribosomal subunit protein eL24-related N-terminal domain-containing protein n=1 Tax=Ophiocordyceps camponoti-rufipedis TaxID=2004952 RepID=A0A2C5YS25_9HYPO|nr:hypothetical protein CDD80_6094 [Ophiocordyceps camponoti-rufipedis]